MIRAHDKILCCCSWGVNRSVHARWLLGNSGYTNVLTLGLEHTDVETVSMLCAWADVILVVGERGLLDSVPFPYRYKTTLLEVGVDRWGGWQREDLLSILTQLLKSLES